MKNYLAVIRRADFNDLYKYGTFNLDKDKIVDFTCSISELHEKYDIFDLLFSKMNAFEKSFAYIIIHYIKENCSKEDSKVYIEEVQHIYPLDFEAKREFDSSFDKHIRIESPIWSDAIALMKKREMFESSMRGVNNIFKIFKLDDVKKCKSIINDDIVESMLSDVYDDIRPSGELSIWVYLMRYERHSFYPKDSLGYFMDIVHIVLNYMSKQEVDDFAVESTSVFGILNSLVGYGYKSDKIMSLLNENESASAFLNKVRSFVPEIDFIITAVNYLKLRDLYKDEFKYEEPFVETCKDTFKECFTLASYMLGIALSHDKTYSCLYKSLPLSIYKSEEELRIITLQEEMAKEKAKREMELIERERELERERRAEPRKKKKKENKGGNKPPFGISGSSSGRDKYSIPELPLNMPTSNGYYVTEIPDSTPSTLKVKDDYNKNQYTNNPIHNLNPEKSNNEPTKISFPAKVRRYKKDGSPYKKGIRIVKNMDELRSYLTKSDENWELYFED